VVPRCDQPGNHLKDERSGGDPTSSQNFFIAARAALGHKFGRVGRTG